jgi:hypothetical protein
LVLVHRFFADDHPSDIQERQATKEINMKLIDILSRSTLVLALALMAAASWATDYPAPKEDDWVVRDFRFHTGDVLPELRLHYTTVGAPSGEPVLILHGTTGSGAGWAPGDRGCVPVVSLTWPARHRCDKIGAERAPRRRRPEEEP